MSTRTCCVLAVLVALAGASLRLAVPVTPPDAAYREGMETHPPKLLP